ncbi:MAG: 23S rRNA (guanosine(2251)-2'-O)-methyltransferase RlmB [Acidobacteriota bacterium]
MATIYGFHPVRELLRHRPQDVEAVLIARRPGKRRDEIEALARRHRIAVDTVAESILREHSGGAPHNGVVARVRAVTEPVPTSVDTDLRVLVEDVQDPHNLGALLRVCEGAGVGQVLVRDRGSAPITATVRKVSAGAAEWLTIERVTNSGQRIKRLKDEGFWVYGAAAGGDAPWDVDLSGKVALCFGGEEKGLRARTRELCDGLLGLPLRGRVESLNLSTAAAAVLYEAVRQRS